MGSVISKICDKLFVPVLIGGVAFLGHVLYKKGREDAIHQIYERGWRIVMESDDDTKFEHA
jgi:hypothetical protein